MNKQYMKGVQKKKKVYVIMLNSKMVIVMSILLQ